MQVHKTVPFSSRNVWLLLLPIATLVSWIMQETPVADRIIFTSSAVKNNTDNNFYQLEQLLGQLYVTDVNKLMINAQTEKYLSHAVNNFGVEFDEKLFEKSFPSPQGKQLGNLLQCYAEYKRAEQHINQRYLVEQASQQLLDYRVLQKVFFGDIAKNLFADHHHFYQSVEAAGVQLISPILTGIVVAPVCTEIREVVND